MDVKYVVTTEAKLPQLTIINGQLIYLSDKNAAYYDMGGVRNLLSSVRMVSQLPAAADAQPNVMYGIVNATTGGVNTYIWDSTLSQYRNISGLIATTEAAGLVKPDGVTITIDANGVISSVAAPTAFPASSVTYDNTTSALAATNVQLAIDEVKAMESTAVAIAKAATAVADTAMNLATTASADASTALVVANTALSRANAATATANTALSSASSAVDKANAATATAATAVSRANAATAIANTATNIANSAVNTANAATSTAATATNTATTASNVATDALNRANAATAGLANLGSAAEKNYTDTVVAGSNNLVTSDAVRNAIDAAIASVYKPAGTKTVAQLTSSLLVAGNVGNVYNITDSGVTTSDFVEGAGQTISAGTDVVIIDTGSGVLKFTRMSSTVDLSAYQTKSLVTPLTINGSTRSTVEDALGQIRSIDTTLAVSGADADSKAVGDKINQVAAEMVLSQNSQPYSTYNKVWFDTDSDQEYTVPLMDDVASAISNSIGAGLLVFGTDDGSKTCAQLTASLLTAANYKKYWTVTDQGTTTANFINGAGKAINPADRVMVVRNPSTSAYMFYLVIPDTMDGLEQEASSYSDTIEQIISGYEDDVDEFKESLANYMFIPLEWTQGKYIKADGSADGSSANMFATSKVYFNENSKYILISFTPSTYAVEFRIAQYNESDEVIEYLALSKSNYKLPWAINSNTKYIRISNGSFNAVTGADIKHILASMEFIEEAELHPVSRYIDPISNQTKMDLYSLSWENGKYLTNNQSISTNPGMWLSGKVPVSVLTDLLVIKFTPVTTGECRVRFFDQSDAQVGGNINITTGKIQFAVPSGASYMRMSTGKYDATNTLKEVLGEVEFIITVDGVNAIHEDLDSKIPFGQIDLMSVNWTVGKVISGTGAISNNAGFILSDPISISRIKELYVLLIKSAYVAEVRFSQYNRKMEWLGNTGLANKATIQTNPNAAYFRLSVGNWDSNPMTTDIVKNSLTLIMKGPFKKLRDAIASYKGLGEINTQIDRWKTRKYINGTGGISDNVGMIMSDKIYFTDEKEIIIQFIRSTIMIEARFAQYDSSDAMVGNMIQISDTKTIQRNTDAVYFRISAGNWNNVEVTEAQATEALHVYEYQRFRDLTRLISNNTILDRCAEQIPNVFAGCSAYRAKSESTAGPTKNFALLMISDSHGDTVRLQNAVDLLNGCEAIDGMIHLGDALTSSYNTTEPAAFAGIVNTASKPVLAVLGNHDSRNYKTTQCTIEQAVTAYQKSTTLGSIYEDRGYAYYDFDNYKIRIIMLNDFDYPNDLDGDNNYKYYGAETMFLQEQVDWFVDTLENTPNDYTVIIASHYTEPSTFDGTKIPLREDAQDVPGLHYGSTGYMGDTIVGDIVHAFTEKTTLSKSYTYTLPGSVTGVTVDADFSARTNSLFACYICGHTHRQSIGKNTAYTDQVVYINDTSCLYAGNNSSTMWPSYWSLLARNPKGKTQDVLTVLCIDTANKMINLVRVGADKNMYGDDSSFINYSYDPQQ